MSNYVRLIGMHNKISLSSSMSFRPGPKLSKLGQVHRKECSCVWKALHLGKCPSVPETPASSKARSLHFVKTCEHIQSESFIDILAKFTSWGWIWHDAANYNVPEIWEVTHFCILLTIVWKKPPVSPVGCSQIFVLKKPSAKAPFIVPLLLVAPRGVVKQARRVFN